VLLIVDEWNYDNGVNLSAERRDRVFVSASYIPARLKHMYEAGIDHQVFFSLEDFVFFFTSIFPSRIWFFNPYFLNNSHKLILYDFHIRFYGQI